MYNLTATSIVQVYSYTLALPYFTIGFILMIIGIVWLSTHREQLALLTGLVASALMTAIIPNIINIGTTSLLALLYFATLFLNMLHSRKHRYN